MAKARRVGSAAVRERYRAFLVAIDTLYGYVDGSPWAAQIAHVDAGGTFRCHAYEVDLLPPTDLLEVDGLGNITVVRTAP